MREFELHPVEYAGGQAVEHPSIGSLMLDDEGFELLWDDPDTVEELEERLEEFLESPIHGIAPHPDPTMRATVRIELEVGGEEWLRKVQDVLEGPSFRLRMHEKSARR